MAVLLVYGSQTGQSEAVAEQIATIAGERGLEVTLVCGDKTDCKLLHHVPQVAVFVVSSTGEGDPPDNFEELWTKLNTEPPRQLDYTVLGLGDSNYTEFGGFPTMLNQHLKDSGCNEFYDFALADDAVGLELVIEPWIEDLWEPLTNIIKRNEKLVISKDINLKFNVELCKGPKNEDNPLVDLILDFKFNNDSSPMIFPDGIKSFILPFIDGKLEEAEIASTKRITSDSELVKQTFEYEIKTTESYSAGDSFGILCQNSDQEIENILNQLAEDPCHAHSIMDITVKPDVKKRLIPRHFLNCSSIYYYLKYVLDIHALPKKIFLRYLAECCSDEEEKRFLAFLASRDGNDELKQLIYDQGLSLLDLLNMFPSCRPSIVGLIQFLPRLMPRYYSVSRITDDGTIKFVFNWIENKRKHEPSIPGVCTSYLKTLRSGDKVYIYKRKNDNFKPNDSRSMILIGAGTGVSPFLGFLDHVYKEGVNTTVTLVTGNRYKNLDSIYREEFMFYLTKSVLTSYYAAHSRDKCCKHRYVQDIIRDYTDFFVNKFDEGATVFVCGDAKGLGASVFGAFAEIISKRKYMSIEEAEAYLVQKKKQGLYLEDIWS